MKEADCTSDRVFGTPLLNDPNCHDDSMYTEPLVWEQEDNPEKNPLIDHVFEETDGAAFHEWQQANPDVYASRTAQEVDTPITQALRKMTIVGMIDFGIWHATRYGELEQQFATDKPIIDAEIAMRTGALAMRGLVPSQAVLEIAQACGQIAPIKPIDSFCSVRNNASSGFVFSDESRHDPQPYKIFPYMVNAYENPTNFRGIGDDIIMPLHMIAENLRLANNGLGFSNHNTGRPVLSWVNHALRTHLVEVATTPSMPATTIINPLKRHRILSEFIEKSGQNRDLLRPLDHGYGRFWEERILLSMGRICLNPSIPASLLIDAYNSPPESNARFQAERQLDDSFRSAYPNFTANPLYAFTEKYNQLAADRQTRTVFVMQTAYDLAQSYRNR